MHLREERDEKFRVDMERRLNEKPGVARKETSLKRNGVT